MNRQEIAQELGQPAAQELLASARLLRLAYNGLDGLPRVIPTRTLFGLQSAWPPYHDSLGAQLPQIEEAQGWPPGYLQDALLRLVRDDDPTLQQEVEQRVEDLMASNGIAHEWGNDLEPLKALRFGGDR